MAGAWKRVDRGRRVFRLEKLQENITTAFYRSIRNLNRPPCTPRYGELRKVDAGGG